MLLNFRGFFLTPWRFVFQNQAAKAIKDIEGVQLHQDKFEIIDTDQSGELDRAKLILQKTKKKFSKKEIIQALVNVFEKTSLALLSPQKVKEGYQYLIDQLGLNLTYESIVASQMLGELISKNTHKSIQATLPFDAKIAATIKSRIKTNGLHTSWPFLKTFFLEMRQHYSRQDNNFYKPLLEALGIYESIETLVSYKSAENTFDQALNIATRTPDLGMQASKKILQQVLNIDPFMLGFFIERGNGNTLFKNEDHCLDTWRYVMKLKQEFKTFCEGKSKADYQSSNNYQVLSKSLKRSNPGRNLSPKQKNQIFYWCAIMDFLRPYGKYYSYDESAPFSSLLPTRAGDAPLGDCNQISLLYMALYNEAPGCSATDIQLINPPHHLAIVFNDDVRIEATAGYATKINPTKNNYNILPPELILEVNLGEILPVDKNQAIEKKVKEQALALWGDVGLYDQVVTETRVKNPDLKLFEIKAKVLEIFQQKAKIECSQHKAQKVLQTFKYFEVDQSFFFSENRNFDDTKLQILLSRSNPSLKNKTVLVFNFLREKNYQEAYKTLQEIEGAHLFTKINSGHKLKRFFYQRVIEQILGDVGEQAFHLRSNHEKALTVCTNILKQEALWNNGGEINVTHYWELIFQLKYIQRKQNDFLNQLIPPNTRRYKYFYHNARNRQNGKISLREKREISDLIIQYVKKQDIKVETATDDFDSYCRDITNILKKHNIIPREDKFLEYFIKPVLWQCIEVEQRNQDVQVFQRQENEKQFKDPPGAIYKNLYLMFIKDKKPLTPENLQSFFKTTDVPTDQQSTYIRAIGIMREVNAIMDKSRFQGIWNKISVPEKLKFFLPIIITYDGKNIWLQTSTNTNIDIMNPKIVIPEGESLLQIWSDHIKKHIKSSSYQASASRKVGPIAKPKTIDGELYSSDKIMFDIENNQTKLSSDQQKTLKEKITLYTEKHPGQPMRIVVLSSQNPIPGEYLLLERANNLKNFILEYCQKVFPQLKVRIQRKGLFRFLPQKQVQDFLQKNDLTNNDDLKEAFQDYYRMQKKVKGAKENDVITNEINPQVKKIYDILNEIDPSGKLKKSFQEEQTKLTKMKVSIIYASMKPKAMGQVALHTTTLKIPMLRAGRDPNADSDDDQIPQNILSTVSAEWKNFRLKPWLLFHLTKNPNYTLGKHGFRAIESPQAISLAKKIFKAPKKQQERLEFFYYNYDKSGSTGNPSLELNFTPQRSLVNSYHLEGNKITVRGASESVTYEYQNGDFTEIDFVAQGKSVKKGRSSYQKSKLKGKLLSPLAVREWLRAVKRKIDEPEIKYIKRPSGEYILQAKGNLLYIQIRRSKKVKREFVLIKDGDKYKAFVAKPGSKRERISALKQTLASREEIIALLKEVVEVLY